MLDRVQNTPLELGLELRLGSEYRLGLVFSLFRIGVKVMAGLKVMVRHHGDTTTPGVSIAPKRSL